MTKYSHSNNQFRIDAVWDDDAEVWVAESEEVPGLIAEADSHTHLIEKLTTLIPELLELNCAAFDPHKPIDLEIHYKREKNDREERIRLPKAA